MPYRDLILKNQPFHIISRAVDEKKIFSDESDCYRFIFQLYAANLGKPNFNLRRLDVVKTAQALLSGQEVPEDFIIKEHPPLVHILDFALNVTHYHLYLLPTDENNVSNFIRKLNVGFAKYFNLKYQRKGSLFGSRFKSVRVETDLQSDAVSRYVSVVNPLDMYQPGWREGGLHDKEKALKFLKKYPFSSFPDKMGKRNSKILASKEIINKYCPNDFGQDYINSAKDYLDSRLNAPYFLE